MDTTQTAPDAVAPYRWLLIGLWLLCSVSGFMVAATLGILLPDISADLHLSPSQQGLLGSSAFWGNLALAVPLSWWTSRFGPKVLTTVTMVLGTLFLFVQGWAPVFAVLVAGRLAFGITVIARQPAQAILTQHWFKKREIVLVNSLSNALFGLVVGGGLVAAPPILASLGGDWRVTLQIFGGLFAVLTLVWMVLGRERTTQASPERRTTTEAGLLRGSLFYRDLWIGGLGFVGPTLTWAAFLSFFPTLMLDTYQVSLQLSGAILALGVLLGGLAGLPLGYVVMKTGRGKPILQATGALLVGTYVGMTLTGSVPLLLSLSFLNGIAWGFWPVLYTVAFHLPGIQPRQVAIALSFTLTMTSMGMVLGPLVSGFLQEVLSLKLSLLLVSFAPISLLIAGFALRTEPGGRRLAARDGPAPS